MAILPSAWPKRYLSREEIARVEVGHTDINRATVRFLLVFFLAAIALVPVVEWAGARARLAEGAASAWVHLAAVPAQVSASLSPGREPAAGTWIGSRIIAANRAVLAGLSTFEDGLEDESLIGRTLRPPAQAVLTGALGAGNERVYVGRERWLFYRPDVEYVTGPGFLAPSQLRRRVAAASEWVAPPQPDPRLAVSRFKLDLDARTITLIVMPTPLKPTIHPEKLAARYGDEREPLHNPSYAAFIDDLRRDGVLVFDVTEALMEARQEIGAPQYLATDTHWRPEAMELAAGLLARFIERHVSLPPAPDPGYGTITADVRQAGDTAVMLDLPRKQRLYPPEPVQIRRVLEPNGAAWRPSRGADVLLLGDSFTNIYSLDALGWGESAGLAEHLSLALNRPVDRLVQNDEGAYATRAMLRRALAIDPARLRGVRVIVYQFAARELAFGDWQVIDLPRP